jgi:hypothetical protein
MNPRFAWRRIAVVAAAMALASTPSLDQPMTPTPQTHPALATFAGSIDLDGRLAREDATTAVVAEWPDLGTAPGTAGFSPPTRNLRWEGGGVYRTSVIRRGAEKLKLSLFVAETDPARAADALREVLGATMMTEIPYQPGPAGLGTLSLRAREQPGLAEGAPGQRALLWVYRHQFFALYGEATAVPLEPIARWLQAAAEAGLRPAAARDAARPRLPPNAGLGAAAAVGAPLVVRAPAGLQLEIGRDPINLQITAVSPDEVRFHCATPGPARGDIHLIAPRSLLSATATVDLRCTP